MISDMVRQEIKHLKAYKEGGISCTIKMDANENAWGLPEKVKTAILEDITGFQYHRYPDSDSTELRQRLSLYTGVKPQDLMVGNGSDELIQYIVQTFVSRGDRVIIQSPTFSMYGFFTRLMGGTVVEVQGDKFPGADVGAIIDTARSEGAKLVFLCNPNNPTGSVLASEEIKAVLERVPGIVVVDEAYFEFHGESVIEWIYRYNNLIVLRTFSKAMAIGGLRVGYLAAGDDIMDYLSRVKVPYNVGSFSQSVAIKALKHVEEVRKWLVHFDGVRRSFIESLSAVDGVNVLPSRANFVLIEICHAERIWKKLLDKGILVRRFGDERLRDYLRVTIGSPRDNEVFLDELIKILGEVQL